MTHNLPPFEQRLATALDDPHLKTALDRALASFRTRRADAFAELDFEALRQDLKARKERALDQLPALIERFRAEAERVGAQVHLAATAEEANRLVVEIARRRGVRLAVKSKSMVTEEIGLNAHLQAAGVEVVETDLGEWVLQLSGDHPSHIIAPALHLRREDWARIFSEATGQAIPPEIQELVGLARRQLRQKFVEADLGISGANVAIAESGTIVVVSNEGNARLATTLPPVHVAICGVEKIVPTLDDATAILKLLARSGTGQKQTSYVSFITGPSRSSDVELTPAIGVHGPEEMHVILLDNGRLAMRDDPDFREALHCIRCGACAYVCPPYAVVGGHAFGHVYTGPIGLILTAFHHGLDNAAGPQSLCASCNACEQVCPAGIPLPRQIVDLRARVVERKGLPGAKAAMLRTLADPGASGRLAGLASLLQLPFTLGGRYVNWAPVGPAKERWRKLPALAPRPLRRQVSRLLARLDPPVIPGSQAAGLTVAYFAGCLTDRLYPEMGAATIQVLRACGARVIFPAGQHCCGLPAANAGDRPDARRMARQTIETLESLAADYILSGSTSCVVAIAQDYPHLFRDDPQWRARAESLARKIVDFTSFLDRVVQLPDGALADGPRLTVTYHDACQSYNCLGLRAEPRRIVREVLGHDLVEMADSHVCCGFGGSFSVDHPRLAEQILARKLAHLKATGASLVVADNPGCLLQLRGGLRARGERIEALHLAELVVRTMDG